MAKDKIKGITIEIGGDTGGLKKALKDVDVSISKTSGELKQVNRLLKLDPKNTELLAQKQELLSKNINTTKDKLQALKDAKEKADAAMKNGTKINEEEYRLLQREIVETEQKLKSLESENSKFTAAADKLDEIGTKATELGKKISVISGAAAAGLAAGVKMASDFEDAFAKTLTIADTSEISAEELKRQIKDLSNESGIAAADIADNVYNAISAGQKTTDAVKFVENAAKLAKAGFTDSASALDILTTAMNAYGLEASEVTRVSDLLIGTQNLGKTTVAELAQNMGRVIPTAKANNVEIEQLSTGYAILTANGVATAESTTYLNAMLNELGKGGTNVDNILRQKTGSSFSQLSEQGKSLGDVLQILNDYAEENNKSFGDLWSSSEAGKAGLVLLGDGADKFNSKLQEMNSQTGATDSAFEKLDTSSDKVKKAINQLKNVLAELGENLLTSLQPIIEKITDKIKSFSNWFGKLNDNQKETVLKIAAVVAAIGPALTIFGNTASTISKVTKAVELLKLAHEAQKTATEGATIAQTVHTAATKLAAAAQGALNFVMSANPIALVVIAVAALTAGFILLWNKCEGFRNFFIGAGENIKETAEKVGGAIASFFTEKIPEAFGKVKSFFENNWQTILAFIINPVAGAVKLLYDTNPKFKAWVDNLVTSVKKWFGKMADIGKHIITGIWNGINDKIEWLKSKVSGVVNKIKSWFTGKKGFDEHSPSKWSKQVFEYVMDGAVNGVESKKDKLLNSISDLVTDTKTEEEKVIESMNEVLLESEIKYNKESERLKDSQLDSDKKYLEDLKKIAEQERKIYDAQVKDFETAKNKIADTYKNLVNEIYSSVDEIKNAESSLESKLKSFGTMYSKVTVEIDGNSESFLTLADLKGQTEQLREYSDLLTRVRDRGNVPKEFFAALRDMSIEEGTDFAKSLLGTSDDKFADFISDWTEKQEAAAEISKILYRDEATDAVSEASKKFEEISENFFAIGADSAGEFEQGFLDNLRNVILNIADHINNSFVPIVDSLSQSMLDTINVNALAASAYGASSVVNNSSVDNSKKIDVTINQKTSFMSAFEEKKQMKKMLTNLSFRGLL